MPISPRKGFVGISLRVDSVCLSFKLRLFLQVVYVQANTVVKVVDQVGRQEAIRWSIKWCFKSVSAWDSKGERSEGEMRE